MGESTRWKGADRRAEKEKKRFAGQEIEGKKAWRHRSGSHPGRW